MTPMIYKRSEIKYIGGIYPMRSEGSIEVPIVISYFVFQISAI